MAYIETETAEPVTYSDSGPGGGGGCESKPKRPKDPVTGKLKPIKKTDLKPHWDPNVEAGAYVCFYNKDAGGEPIITLDSIKSRDSKVTLKSDGTTEIDDDWLKNEMLRALGLDSAEDFITKFVQKHD